MPIRKHHILPAILFTLLLVWSGCQSDESIPDVVVNIDPSFSIEMKETLDTIQQKFGIVAQSVEDQDCLNYGIAYSFDRLNGVISVSLNDLVPPADCIPGNGPALSEILVGYLVNGIFQIELNIKNTVKNLGSLQVSDESYVLEMESMDGILVKSSTLHRIPAQTIWGYVNYEESDYEIPALEFIQEIEELCEPVSLEQGEYYHFMINASDEVIISGQPEAPYPNSFIYRYTGTKQSLKDVLENFRSDFPESLNMKIFTASGEEL